MQPMSSVLSVNRFLVLSDTHDDPFSMEWTLDFLQREKIDGVIHLGDYYNDADMLDRNGHLLIRVPGTWDTCYYPDPAVENRKLIRLGEWRIFLTHTPHTHYNDLASDINPESVITRGEADLFLYGHTHIAEIRRTNGMIFINPGHMTRDESRGCGMSCGLLEFDGDTLSAKVIRIRDNRVRLKGTFHKDPLKMPAGI